VRNAVTTLSRPAQIPVNSDFEISDFMPNAATRWSTDLVEAPRT
jgi:hypothetical protein